MANPTFDRAAIRAYQLEDPSYFEWTDEQIAETIGFRLFNVVWEAERLAEDFMREGFPEVGEAFRREITAKAQETRRKLDETRDEALRQWGFIP